MERGCHEDHRNEEDDRTIGLSVGMENDYKDDRNVVLDGGRHRDYEGGSHGN